MTNTIDTVLRGDWKHPACGSVVSMDIDSVVIAKGVTEGAVELLAPLGLGKRLGLVVDPNTYAALGEQLGEVLQKDYVVTLIMLPEGVAAEERYVEEICARGAAVDAYVAVGSGTINDLVKYASFLAGKPYAVFGTAPSMNGYASVNASITSGGHKGSLSAQLPRGIFLDVDVLAAAPMRLIASGLGDSVCRPTAQSDWLLSQYVLGTAYETAPFCLLEEVEGALFGKVERLKAREKDAIAHLAETLVLSGFGMTLCGGSYPASQGEHMIAHTLEMVHGKALPQHYHGEAIGVTTLMMARKQEMLLARESAPHIRTLPERNVLTGYMGEQLAEACVKSYMALFLSETARKEAEMRLQERWPEIREALGAVMVPAEDIAAVLKAAVAPTTPEELGWPADWVEQAWKYAGFTRDRFTFLLLE